MSSETMTLQHPMEISGGEESQDTMHSYDGKVVSMTASLKTGVEDVEEDSVEDFNHHQSQGRRKMIILSDDEDSNPCASVSRLSVENEENSGQRKMKDAALDSESDDDALFNKELNIKKTKVVYNRDIFDTELSDEDQPAGGGEPPLSPSAPQEESGELVPQNDKKKVSKSRESSARAQQEVMEIHSESQRLVRESQVSLPYHRPKQRTLAEFLARRKQTMPPKIQKQSLKMSMRNIEALKLLEEKKKQAEEFYKSDSDSEDPDDLDWAPEKEGKPTETEEEPDMCTTTDKSVSNASSPDPAALCSESSTQRMESQEGCFESLPLTCHTEDEGIGTCEENVQKDPSSPSSTAQLGDIANKEQSEDSFPTKECRDPEEKEDLEDVAIKTGADTEGLSNTKEAMGKELLTTVREEWNESDIRNSTEKGKLKTPKLNLLASRLPEEEMKKIMSVTPKLSLGKEGDFIDLEEKSTPSRDSGVCELINRFLKHSGTKRKPVEKHHVNLNIVSKEDDGAGGKRLVSSDLLVTVDAVEEEHTSEGVPGARFTSFKAALKARIREQRELNRLKRVQEKQFMETEELPEDYQNEDNLPDEEVELTDQSETDDETESEPEENDIPMIDKKRNKSSYMDDEAEEEDDGGLEPDISESEEETCPTPDSANENNISEDTKKQKGFIKDPEDGSEGESENLTLNWEQTQDMQSPVHPAAITHSNTDELFPSLTCKKGEVLEKDTSTTSFDSSFELYGSVIAGHQPGGGTKLSAENELSILNTKNKSSSFSSTTSSNTKRRQDLTLPTEDSFDIFNTEATSASPVGLELPFYSLDSTHPHESDKENNPVAKLQLDFCRIDGTQTQSKEDLIGLCSGKFTDQPVDPSQMKELCEDRVSSTQEISELLGLCTGRFAAQKEGQCSPQAKSQGGPTGIPHSQDEPDDELLGLCTSKFTMSTNSQREPHPEEKAEKIEKEEDKREASPRMIVYSSDDENSVDIKSKTIKRKKRKRVLEFSDDEDAREPLAFDDEENEVPRTVFTGFKDKTKGGIRADFLENEAELSGSDENSDDEVEGSEDDEMDEEEGDMEHFDRNELRNQVGKAHLRSLLDSDKREVRLLQELYLEDGELHGQGRSRQFRWKNLNKNIEEDERKALSDENEGSDDNMEDGEWRRQKVEREKFLQEQSAKVADTEAELYEMSYLPRVQNLTKEGLVNRKLPFLAAAAAAAAAVAPAGTKSSFTSKLQPKRGSFLSRDKTTLARIAEFTKDRRDVVGGAKQGGNFVFQQLSEEELQNEGVKEEKATVKHKKRHSLPLTKKAKVNSFSIGKTNNHIPSIFKHL